MLRPRVSFAPHPLDATLAAVLPAGSLYAVGGRVRDEVRSALDGVARPAKDLDYVVVGLEMSDVLARLSALGRADVVGASFAVVKLTLGATTVDVAVPRRERSTGVAHRAFTVESGPSVPLADDLARRDFRMNMLARALPAGDLIDPYDGAADIRTKRIDVLRAEAFAEDPLRMLRACQFAARFEFAPTPRTLSAMRAAAPLVASVSAERVRDEFTKFVGSATRPSLGIELMREGGLLEVLLPEIADGIGVTQNAFHAHDVYRHGLSTMDAVSPGEVTLRLAALLHDIGKPMTKTSDPADPSGAHFYRHEIVGAEMARELLERLRFPKELVDDVVALVAHHMYVADPRFEPKALRRFVRRIGLERLERQFGLRAADIVGSGLPKRDDSNELFEARVAEILSERPPVRISDVALSGDAVVGLLVAAGRLPAGSRGGPEVGQVLRALLERVLDDPACNDAETLRELATVEIARLSLAHAVL